MIPAAFSFIYLILTSLLLSAILAAGWKMFGRPRHAATWCAVFAISTLWWATRLIALSVSHGSAAIGFVSAVLATAAGGLLVLGFRQRAQLPRRQLQLAIISAVAIAGAAFIAMRAPSMVVRTTPQLFSWAIFMTLAAATMLGQGRRPNPAEKTAITVLLAFAAFDAGAVAWGLASLSAQHPPSFAFFRDMLLLVLPTGFMALGLSAVFLLAADLADQMRLLATVDPLTNILNRRGFEQAAAQSIAHCRRQRLPLGVVLADLDRFKELNDRFGHAAGDVALQRFARHVSGAVRVGDSVGRIGGEEFAFLLVDTSPAAAVEVVERIRAGVASLQLEGARGAMTASFGVAALRASDRSLDDVMARADAALYASKMAGRDRVTLADSGGDAPTEKSPAVA